MRIITSTRAGLSFAAKWHESDWMMFRVFDLFVITLFLLALCTAAIASQQHSIPTCVYDVHSAVDRTDGSVVSVYCQYGDRFTGFVAKRYTNGVESTICEYLIDATIDEMHLPIAIDSTTTKVVLVKSSSLGVDLSVLVFDLPTQSVVNEYSVTRVLTATKNGSHAVVLDASSHSDSMDVLAINLVNGERYRLTTIKKEQYGYYESSLFVIGNRLLVVDGYKYRVVNIENGDVTGNGSISTELRASIDEDRVVVDNRAGLLIYDFLTSSKTVLAIDVVNNQPVQFSVSFNVVVDDAELAYCNRNAGVYVFEYRNLFQHELFVEGRVQGVKRWWTYGQRFFFETAQDEAIAFIGTARSVSMIDLTSGDATEPALTMNPVYIRFVGDEERVLFCDGPNNVLYDYNTRSVADYAPNYYVNVNDVTGFTYSCSYSGETTRLSIDSTNELGAFEHLYELNNPQGCDLTALTGNGSMVLSANSDSGYVYNLPQAERVGEFELDASLGTPTDACVAPNQRSYFVIGKQGAMRCEVGDATLETEFIPSVYSGHAVLPPNGHFYTDSIGNEHMVFQPDAKKIGDYDISTKSTQYFDPFNKLIYYIIVNENGVAMVITGEPKAYWVDVSRQRVLSEIQLDTITQIRTADYSFEKSAFAFRSKNNVIIRPLPLTSVASGDGAQAINTQRIQATCIDGIIHVSSDDADIVSVKVFDIQGALLSTVSGQSSNHTASCDVGSMGTQAMYVVVADVKYMGNTSTIATIVAHCR